MGDRNRIVCCWLKQGGLDSSHPLLISTLQSVGFTIDESGENASFDQYRPNGERITSDTAVETMEQHLYENNGEITLWHGDLDFTFTFHEYSDGASERFAPVSAEHDIGLQSEKGLFDTDRDGWEQVVSRSDTVFKMFRAVAELVDPWYGICSFCRPTGVEWPTERPPESGLSALPWGAVFNDEWAAEFGGKERLLQTPAYEVDELSTGSVFVRAHDIPNWVGQIDELDKGPWLSAEEYLFDQRSKEDMRAERRRLESTYTDPLRDLDPGQKGIDIVVCPEHAPVSTRDIDYRSVTDATSSPSEDGCYVLWVYHDGENNCLREVDTGSFVRRFVDEDGQPIGEKPAGIPDRNELLSLKVQNEWDGTSYSAGRVDTLDTDDVDSTVAYIMGVWRFEDTDSIWEADGELGPASEQMTWWGED